MALDLKPRIIAMLEFEYAIFLYPIRSVPRHHLTLNGVYLGNFYSLLYFLYSSFVYALFSLLCFSFLEQLFTKNQTDLLSAVRVPLVHWLGLSNGGEF